MAANIRFVKLLAAMMLFVASMFPGFAGAQGGEYVLGAGDIVKISVFQNPDLMVETRVSEAGTITFPLVGSVQVGSLSISAAEQRIAKALRDGKFVLQPQVNILVTQMRGSQVAVLGQVTRPGRYPLEMVNMKVTDALALAGGIIPTGADTVVVVGSRNGKPYRKEVDLPSLFQSGDTADNNAVIGGDILYVHRAPMFYIYGEVQRAGAYRVERGMTVMQALATGGGVTQRGTEKGLRLHRRGGKDGALQSVEPKMDDKVAADDVLYVRESLF